MKHSTPPGKLILLICVAVFVAFSFSSCGTIAGAITGQKRPSFILNAPADLVVKADGKEVKITKEAFASTSIGNTTTTWYTSGVKLPYKKPLTLEFSSVSQGKTVTLDLKPKRSSAIFWGNVLIMPIGGHIIDGLTNNNKMLQPKFIDVSYVFKGVPLKDWPSQGKLKRMQKRKINKGKV